MLKKISGKITKLLFYIKTNFISIFFKLTVFITMLILIYLVCILKQVDSARSSDFNDMYPIESSLKLMQTEDPFKLVTPPTTTEALTTTSDSYASKTSDYFETHPLFPIQIQETTTPIFIDETTRLTTTPTTTHITTTETRVIPGTMPFKRSLSIDELNLWHTTTDSLTKVTTVKTKKIKKPQEEEPEELTTSSRPSRVKANQIKKQQEEEHSEEPEELTTSSRPTTTEHLPFELEISTTPIPLTTSNIAEPDELFKDNYWSTGSSKGNDDTQIYPPEETSSPLNQVKQPAVSLFLNEDNELGAIESPIPKNDTSDSHDIEDISQSTEEIKQSDEVFKFENPHKDFKNKMSLDIPHILSPNKFFNLFSLDHLPSTSNVRPTWWPKSPNAPVPVPNSNKRKPSRKRQANSIPPMVESDEEDTGLNQYHELDMLNKKLIDSVNFFERLFGMFHE